jgi:hypothetical protein
VTACLVCDVLHTFMHCLHCLGPDHSLAMVTHSSDAGGRRVHACVHASVRVHTHMYVCVRACARVSTASMCPSPVFFQP